MKYEGIVAIMDDVPDNIGDILSENVEFETNPVSVSMQFNGDPIGFAFLTKASGKVLAEITIDENKMTPEEVEQFKAVVGGISWGKEGAVITRWSINEIALTLLPSDKRLPNVKRIS